jgi:hypothetical protein
MKRLLWAWIFLFPACAGAEGPFLQPDRYRLEKPAQEKAAEDFWNSAVLTLLKGKPTPQQIDDAIDSSPDAFRTEKALTKMYYKEILRVAQEAEEKQGSPLTEAQQKALSGSVARSYNQYLASAGKVDYEAPLDPVRSRKDLLADASVPDLVKGRVAGMENILTAARALSRQPQRNAPLDPLALLAPRRSPFEDLLPGRPVILADSGLPKPPPRYNRDPNEFQIPPGVARGSDIHLILYDASGYDPAFERIFKYSAELIQLRLLQSGVDADKIKLVGVRSRSDLLEKTSGNRRADSKQTQGLWFVGHGSPYGMHVGPESAKMDAMLDGLRGSGTNMVCNYGCSTVQRDQAEEDKIFPRLKEGETLQLWGHRYIAEIRDFNTSGYNPMTESLIIGGRKAPVRTDYQGYMSGLIKDVEGLGK